MDQATTQKILWIKAIEEGDPQGDAFPIDTRTQATEEATPKTPPATQVVPFLHRRARIALEKLTQQHGQSAATPSPPQHWALLTTGICLLAFSTGLASDRIVNQGTINVISAPLLAILAWNLAVYLWNLLSPIFGKRADTPGLQNLLAPLVGLGKHHRTNQADPTPPWGKLRDNFLAQWLKLTAKPGLLRLRGTLHLGAAALGLGQIAGLYLGGLVRHYLAVWESTFLDAAGFERLAGILFAPASWLTGIPISVTESMNAATGGGVPARDWIHLCAATLLLFVVLPRLLLALTNQLRATRAWRLQACGLDLERYSQDLLRQANKSGLDIIVALPGHGFPDAAREPLRHAIHHAIGIPRSLRFLDAPAYGEEDAFLQSPEEKPDHIFLVFPLTTTPEEEIHGSLAKAAAEIAPGNTIALLHADRFVETFHGQPEYHERLEQRTTAWSRVLQAHRLPSIPWESTRPAAEYGAQIADILKKETSTPTSLATT